MATRVPALRLDVLRALMTELDLSQAELARRGGLAESTVSRLLSDDGRRPTMTTAWGLLRAFPRLRFEDLFETDAVTGEVA